jgi:hypothetical protein
LKKNFFYGKIGIFLYSRLFQKIFFLREVFNFIILNIIMNKDRIILENIYMEMAYGFAEGSIPMDIKGMMDFVIKADKEKPNTTIPFSFTAVTTPRKYEKQFPHQQLYKITQTIGELGEYQKEVNRQLTKRGDEGDFEAQSSNTVGERLSRSVGISKRGLSLIMFNSNLIKNNVTFYVIRDNQGNLKEIDKEEAKQYMYPSSGGKFETDVKWRTYGFDKMVGLRVNKQEMINTEIDDDKMEVFDFIGHKLRA